VAGISISNSTTQIDGIRPVNLQTDLADLADLIESAFSSTMDAGGRAAIREMRQLSRVGFGLGVITNLNELVQGMSLGYVWVVGGKVVGNVSIYPTSFPGDLGKNWIIANVAVYPEYRKRGIATRLLKASLDHIRSRSNKNAHAILQVDLDNDGAQHIYEKLGFVRERVFTQWRRSPFRALYEPETPAYSDLRITQRRLGDAAAEYELARQVRPQSQGGLDWLRPTHFQTFNMGLFKRLNNWLNLRDVQRLVIRSPHDESLVGWMQIESSFGVASPQVSLMTHDDYRQLAAHMLISSVVRRYGAQGINLNHPHDEKDVTAVLREYQFAIQRTVVHMRYDVR